MAAGTDFILDDSQRRRRRARGPPERCLLPGAWSPPGSTSARLRPSNCRRHAGTRHATTAILGTDLEVLLILGSGLNERDTMHWTLREKSKALMIHVNTDLWEMTSQGEAGHCVPGSCGAFLELLSRVDGPVAAALSQSEAARRSWIAGVKAGPRLYNSENCHSPTRPIHPAAAITALRAIFPRDGILLVDSGAHRAFAGHYWTSYEPRTYISATNLGPMG